MDRAIEFYELLRPHFPAASIYASILLSALFPIFTGAHASLSRPVSATPPKKEKKDKRDKSLEDDEEEEDRLQPMESLSALDAILFPIIAAGVLATLYWLIKRYGAKVINLIMSWYLAAAGVFSVIKLISDGTSILVAFIFPPVYASRGKLWHLGSSMNEPAFMTADETDVRRSPFPGLLSRLPMPRSVSRAGWRVRSFLKQKYWTELLLKEIVSVKTKITIVDMFAAAVGIAVVIYSRLVDNHWTLTNLQGFAVSYFAVQMLSPTSFAIGSLVLSGLFFYDIWAVFFTPLMVTVATELDQPIKLVFPRYDLEQDDKPLQFSMLGLGDIVLPGLLIGLCLRYDLYMFYLRRQTKQGSGTVKAAYTSPRGHWANRYWTSSLKKTDRPQAVQNASFPKPFFNASLTGYIVGLALTLVVVAVFQHAQPALLYLVPAVLLSTWGTGLVRGELKQMWAYTEEITGEALPPDANAADAKEPTSWWASLFGSSVKDQKAESVDKGKTRETDDSAKTSEAGEDAFIIKIVLKKLDSTGNVSRPDKEEVKADLNVTMPVVSPKGASVG